MRRIIITSLTLIAAALLVVPATAGAQKRSKTPAPQITRVQPMRVAVGGTLTISGRNFKAQRRKNTVIFRSGNGRTAFAKPSRASKRKLVVRVPAAVSRLLRVANSSQRPTRLQLRVLAGKFSKFTPRRLSPVVTGVGDGAGRSGRRRRRTRPCATTTRITTTTCWRTASSSRSAPTRASRTPTPTRCRTAGSTTRPRT